MTLDWIYQHNSKVGFYKTTIWLLRHPCFSRVYEIYELYYCLVLYLYELTKSRTCSKLQNIDDVWSWTYSFGLCDHKYMILIILTVCCYHPSDQYSIKKELCCQNYKNSLDVHRTGEVANTTLEKGSQCEWMARRYNILHKNLA